MDAIWMATVGIARGATADMRSSNDGFPVDEPVSAGWLLRTRRERPSRRRSAEQRDELASPDAKCHLIPPAEGVVRGQR